jgi:hypothetical protein
MSDVTIFWGIVTLLSFALFVISCIVDFCSWFRWQVWPDIKTWMRRR